MKLLLLAAALVFAAPQDVKKAQDTAPAKVAPAAQDADAAVVDAQLPSYPLETCPVSDEPLGEEPVNVVVEGRLIRTCCKRCVAGVEKDPAKFIEKVNAAVVAAQLASYPLETCPVSGEPLGDAPVDHVVGTRLVRTCCKRCAAAVTKDATKAMAVVDKAYMDAQRPTYPAKTCVVSDEDLGSMGEPVEMLYGTRLVRLCCKGCVKGFKKDPAAFIAKLDKAAK